MSSSIVCDIVLDDEIVSSMDNNTSLVGKANQVLGHYRACHRLAQVEMNRLSRKRKDSKLVEHWYSKLRPLLQVQHSHSHFTYVSSEVALLPKVPEFYSFEFLDHIWSIHDDEMSSMTRVEIILVAFEDNVAC